MKTLKKVTAVVFLAVLCVQLSHAMVTRVAPRNVGKSSKQLFSTMSQDCVKNYGSKPVTIPQTAGGIFGSFKLDGYYGIRVMLAPYIAFNENISLYSAKWENWQKTQRAYDCFLQHNSTDAIVKALDNNSIDTEYAIRALYFSQKVAWSFEEHLEYNRKFTSSYSDDSEQYIYTDSSLYSTQCSQLLRLLEKEQNKIASLVDFLQQSPKGPSLTDEHTKAKRMGLTTPMPRGWSGFIFSDRQDPKSHKFSKRNIELITIPQGWKNTFLGNFPDRRYGYTIYDFLRKYLAIGLQVSESKVEDKAQLCDIKEAFECFLYHNSPDRIYNAFDAKEIDWHKAYDALYFTRFVTSALEKYIANLSEDACDVTVFELLWKAKRIYDQEKSRRLEMPVERGTE